jgi:predicted DNA-binding transcriptional regulator AlpA
MSTYMSMSDSVVSMVRDPFLNTEEACGYLGVPKATLLTWRVRRPGYGPRAVKAGGRLKYRLSELDRWLSAHEESFAEDPDSDEDPSREVVVPAAVPVACEVLLSVRPTPDSSPADE